MTLESERKPDEALEPNKVPSEEGKPADRSESKVDASDTPDRDAAKKIIFCGREYNSLEEAEKNFKELQTTYQRTKADNERLQEELEDKDPFEGLFSAIPDVPLEPAKSPELDKQAKLKAQRDALRDLDIALLKAQSDPQMPEYSENAKRISELLKTDPDLRVMVAVGRAKPALRKAYATAVAERVKEKEKAAYIRGQEEMLKKTQKPTLEDEDGASKGTPKKELKDMS